MDALDVAAIPALKDNYVYVLVDRLNRRAAVFDPGEAAPVEAYLRREHLRLDRILLTHHHNDHIGGSVDLARRHDCEIYCSEFDRPRIPAAKHSLNDQQRLDLLGTEARIIAVPGHTDGQIAYYFPVIEALFAGDTLFSGGCGRLFEGTAEQMFSSLNRLKSLPKTTRLFFGHEYTVSNLKFILGRLKDEARRPGIENYLKWCERQIAGGKPTTPSTLGQELDVNPFFYETDLEKFRDWRTARDTWQAPT